MTALLSFEPEHQRSLFDLVVATLWADGQIADREIAAARGAQIALGLVHPSDESATAIARGPGGERWRTLARAPSRERMIAYAAAVWTALADGVIDPGEASFLREVREVLGLDDASVRFADGLAHYVDAVSDEERAAAAPSDGRSASWHRGFAKLLVDGARRVESVRAHLAAA